MSSEIYFNFDAVKYSNRMLIVKFVSSYLYPPCALRFDGVTTQGQRIANRTGVPQGGETWRYTVTGQGWSMSVRAVWHEGELLRPLATHCVAESYGPDQSTAQVAANVWLKSLGL